MMMDTTNLLPTNIAQRLLKEAARAQKVKRNVVQTQRTKVLAIVLMFVAIRRQKKPVTIRPRVH
jgi:hypothetical protein